MKLEDKKYPGLEMRKAVQGKALDFMVWLDQEKLMEKGRSDMLLRELKKCYKKESIIN